MTPKAAQVAATRAGSAPLTTVKSEPTTRAINAIAVVAIIRAKKTHSARRLSIATAAATNAIAVAERYRANARSVAPGSILMLPASGIPSADAVLFQIGCASPEFGNGIAWINIQPAGSAAMNVTGRMTLDRKPASPGRMRRPTIATDTAAAAAIKLLIIGLSRMTVAGAAKISKTRINSAKTIFGKFSAVCAWAPSMHG